MNINSLNEYIFNPIIHLNLNNYLKIILFDELYLK